MGNHQRPPLVKGDTVELHIDSFNHDGEGVGRFEGFAVFVPEAIPGETVHVRIISTQKTYARALIQSVKQVSPARIQPICEHNRECGGCQLQHLDYKEQLRLKQDIVREALRRIGGLEIPVHPTLGMENPWNYRNKAQIPVGLHDNKIIAGFYKKRSHNIVDLTCCHIQHPANDNVTHTVRRILQELSIPVYQEKEHKGFVRHIMVRTSFTTNDVLVVIITNGHNFTNSDKLVKGLQESVPHLYGIVQNINTRRGNTVLGQEEVTLWGKPWLREKLDGLEFKVSPRSFFQVNPIQTETLYRKAMEYAALTGNETVFDLYCGIGTISLFLARSAAKVIGVEAVEDAVRDARENAALNDINNAEFHVGTAETIVPKLYKEGYQADVVVVDPPRKGCDEALLSTIATMSPKRIVYISCNPSTLARDLKYLNNNGFEPIEAQPVDMFPHTPHVETVTLITRVKE